MRLELNGMEAILQNLMNLPLEEADENRALNKAAKVIQEAVIEEAPQDERKENSSATSIKNNIKIKRAKEGEAKVHTGSAYHAHIIEGGRSAGSKYTLKNGKRQLVTWGPIAPNPFFTRGFENKKSEAVNAMADEIRKALRL
ncbi:hypothetical protein FC756_23225 [Lysinibacillus mangiferihumi]|uniref:HK97 gp10 family phage protein n=1 Tax=Lysinibacillus mangiferihumi TaxID=1130819 RepID=A0A4U2Y327_9BACI|nr:HK97-gp10 family putative phage morphogenesis protein [Lysinibacillus mangiferihumi]TKI53541.1 hypothetical protein FC756_23225 [Lysinibacillus mangiferihumi]